MPGLPPDSTDFLGEIRDLKKRLRKLESKNRSKTEFWDNESGMLETGRIWRDGDLNQILVQTDADRGMVYPHEHTQWVSPDYTALVLADGELNKAECELQLVNGDIIQFSGALVIPSGTTCDVSIYEVFTATYVTQSIAGPVNGFVCEWLHPYSVGWGTSGDNEGLGSSMLLSYRVEVTAGAGTAFVYPPRSLMIRNSRFTSNESATTPFTFS